MCSGNQYLTGVCNARTTGLADNANIPTAFYMLNELTFYRCFRLVDIHPAIIIDHHFLPEALQKPPGGSFVLYKKYLALLNRFEYVGRDGKQSMFVKHGRY